MTLEEAKEVTNGMSRNLLSLFACTIRLKGEQRIHAGFNNAEDIITFPNKELNKHNMELAKILDSVPE